MDMDTLQNCPCYSVVYLQLCYCYVSETIISQPTTQGSKNLHHKIHFLLIIQEITCDVQV